MDAATLPPSTENDSLLKQQIVRCLHQRNNLPHRLLRIDVDQDVVIVRGRLPSFFLRQIAIECIRHVPGVTRVEDDIRVADARETHSKARTSR
jgi:osmotically-inducible protein OsmY